MKPNSDQIRHQLNSILESPAFKASDLLRKFLVYVVEQSLAGNNQNIKAYNIAVDAFGRDSGFDPQLDSIVRITASKLRKELVNYYNNRVGNNQVMIEIPKGKYIPLFSFITKNETNLIEPPKSDTNKKTIKVYRFAIALLLLIIITILAIKFSPQADYQDERPAIVLYEFQNLTADINNSKWAAGFSEEIAVLCSRFSEIDIIGPINKPIDKSIEDKLDKPGGNIFELEGSVISLDSILKVNVRLLDYKTNKILWAKTIQKDIGPENLMDIGYEISNNIAVKISGIYGVAQSEVLNNSNSSRPTKLSSHLSVLKYFQYLRSFDYGDYLIVKDELEKVIVEDPNYALAWSALSSLYLDGYMYYNEDSVESFTNAHKYLSRALEIEPDNVFVQSHRSYYSYLSRNLVDFYDAIEKEKGLNPSNIMIGEVGVFLVLIGDSEKGLKLIKEAQNLSIVYPGYFNLGSAIHYYRVGEFEQALTEVEKANMPGFFMDPLFHAITLINLGETEKAKSAKEEVLGLIPNFTENGSAILKRILYLEQDINSIMGDFNRID